MRDMENCERFQENIDAFSDVISSTDDLRDNQTITSYLLPYSQQSGYQNLMATI